LITAKNWRSGCSVTKGGAYAAKLEAAGALYGSDGAPTAPRVLRRGNRGPDVVALQTALGVRADGDFGPAMEAAVRLRGQGEQQCQFEAHS
jgi:peptidoglycan hydrolase-like protein with peptidoglycan-binding domain